MCFPGVVKPKIRINHKPVFINEASCPNILEAAAEHNIKFR